MMTHYRVINFQSRRGGRAPEQCIQPDG
jgi:hypothetical protein